MPLTMAISARKAISMAAMFSARCNPSPAPRAAASMMFTPGLSTVTVTPPGRDRLANFRHQDLGQHNGGRRGHDHGRQQMANLHVRHQYISRHGRSGDVRHAAHHDGEQLGLGKAFQKRPDGDGRFGLAHEDAGGHVGGFGAARPHHALHHHRHGVHQHLHHAQVIKDREQAADEDDDRQHLKRKDGRLAAAQLIAENKLAAGLRITDDAFTLSLRASKTRAAGVRSTMKANVSCRPTPQRISDGRMERLLLEKRTQTRRIARIPSMPVNRSIMDLYRLPYGRGSVTSAILILSRAR